MTVFVSKDFEEHVVFYYYYYIFLDSIFSNGAAALVRIQVATDACFRKCFSEIIEKMMK